MFWKQLEWHLASVHLRHEDVSVAAVVSSRQSISIEGLATRPTLQVVGLGLPRFTFVLV